MISILMPVFNGIEFLYESISSVKNQNFTEWELLVGLNGHSSQASRRISKYIYKLLDGRGKVFIFSDKGKVKTLNQLVKHANYDLICLLDADDAWTSNKLNTQLQYVEKYDIVGSRAEYIGDVSGEIPVFGGRVEENMFYFQNPIINSSAMIKKKDAEWNEDWEGLDDYNFWLHLMNLGRTFYNVPEILTKHRVHKRSHYNNINSRIAEDLRKSLPQLSQEESDKLSDRIASKDWIL